MSTKTTFKRIALVAVASLGFGLLSAAPSSAAAGATDIIFTLGAAPTTTPTRGAVVTIPINVSEDGGADTATTATLKAELTVKPTNSNLNQFSAMSVDNTVHAAALTTAKITAVAPTAATTTAGVTLNLAAALDSTVVTASLAANFSFTPDVAGRYVVTFTKGGTADTTFTDNTIEINVAGGAILQAQSGLGGVLGAQVLDRASAAAFWLPAASTTASKYSVTITGGSIVGAFDQGAQTGTDAASAVSYTSTRGITTNTPSSWATGFTYDGAADDVTGVVDTGEKTDSFIVQFTSSVAGPVTVTVRSINPTTGVLTAVGTVTVEYGAGAVVSPSLSTVYIGQGNARPSTVETAAIRVPSTAGVALSSTATSGATIAVDVKDTTGAALVNQAITATITGAGLITLAANALDGASGTVRTASLSATAMAGRSAATIGVSGDGTRGVGTITITAGGVTIATKTVTFYGAVATLTATQGVSVMSSGRAADSTAADFTLGGVDPAEDAADATTRTTKTNISIVAKDVDGNVVPLANNPTAVISDALVIGAVNIAACTATSAADSVCADGAGHWIANTVSAIGGVSGASATVTFRTPHPTVAGTFISTAALPFTLGGTKTGGTVTMKLDKATYEPGERVIITYTAKDAAGNPVADWTTVGSPSSNKAMQGLNTAGVYVAGSHIYGDGATEFTYAPTVSGPFTITLGTGTATGATITATATVSDDAATTAAAAAGDAAAEATDAANAATDAANAAAEAADAATAAAQDAADAVAALSTSVTAMVDSLRKQITSLTNLVIKIQRKVRA
jgi:trimeric autotransporter adhesin